MTTKYKEGPLGKVNVLSNVSGNLNPDLSGICQVIGMGLIIDKNKNIGIVGERWPIGTNGKCFDSPPTPGELAKYIQDIQSRDISVSLSENELLDIQIQGKTLLFFTFNMNNFSFRDEVILAKRKKRFDKYFQNDSINISADGHTLFWRSDYEKTMPHDPKKYAYDILVEMTQVRSGGLLKLPIIIDPGTQNGGVGGWP